MARSDPTAEVEYLRLFFPEDREEIALRLAALLIRHLGPPADLIRPDESLEDLLGWPERGTGELVRLLVTLEEEGICPKEAFAEAATFRDLVDYVAEHRPPKRPDFTNS